MWVLKVNTHHLAWVDPEWAEQVSGWLRTLTSTSPGLVESHHILSQSSLLDNPDKTKQNKPLAFVNANSFFFFFFSISQYCQTVADKLIRDDTTCVLISSPGLHSRWESPKGPCRTVPSTWPDKSYIYTSQGKKTHTKNAYQHDPSRKGRLTGCCSIL